MPLRTPWVPIAARTSAMTPVCSLPMPSICGCGSRPALSRALLPGRGHRGTVGGADQLAFDLQTVRPSARYGALQILSEWQYRKLSVAIPSGVEERRTSPAALRGSSYLSSLRAQSVRRCSHLRLSASRRSLETPCSVGPSRRQALRTTGVPRSIGAAVRLVDTPSASSDLYREKFGCVGSL